jgi:hypothetical protein
MQSFLVRHQPEIKGSLSGFDRIRFRGTIRWLANVRGMMGWLWRVQVLLKNFKEYALSLTEQVRRQTERIAESAGRPILYLPSSAYDKEEVAKRIARSDRVTEGLVCVLTCVESCRTFSVGPNAKTKEIELRSSEGKCLHQYFYYQDPQLGWLHLRLQTWLPFTIHLVLNGRDWLACQLRRAGVGYQQRDNCFVDVDDMARAQDLLTRQVKTNWNHLLERLRRRVHPAHDRMFGSERLGYYWSADETEWATDVLFRSSSSLAAIYPRLVRHGITTFGSGDILRFLGRRPSVQHFTAAEISSDVKVRIDGTRIKHRLNRNSIKMYDKQGSVLRVETTINDARDLKSYRASEADPKGPKRWRGLRKGVADLPRRAEISQASNGRYLEALASVDHPTPLGEAVRGLLRPTTWKGRRVRALNPLAGEDGHLLQAISHGEFTLNGFRNRDMLSLLFDRQASSLQEHRRQSAKVTRSLRLLRAHKLIRKVPKTHRYVVTQSGRLAITAILAAQRADIRKLTELAA